MKYLMENFEVGAVKMTERYKTPLAVMTQLLHLYYLFISYNMKLHPLKVNCLGREDSYTRQICHDYKILNFKFGALKA